MNKEIKNLKPKIVEVLKKHKIARAGVFGSYARGEPKKNSDIDILIEFDGSLLKLIHMENELKKKLKRKVDLLTYGCVHPLLKKRILGEEVRII